MREQVFIEAMIIEVKAESGWSFGIDWMLGNQSGSNYYGGAYMNSVPNFTSTTVAGKSTTLPLSTRIPARFRARFIHTGLRPAQRQRLRQHIQYPFNAPASHG